MTNTNGHSSNKEGSNNQSAADPPENISSLVIMTKAEHSLGRLQHLAVTNELQVTF